MLLKEGLPNQPAWCHQFDLRSIIPLRKERNGFLHRNLLALYDQDAPLEMASTIPAAWYIDERIARLENQQVFGSHWIAVGRMDQAAAAGQFFTFDLAVSGMWRSLP
jgi:hypothetical protein